MQGQCFCSNPLFFSFLSIPPMFSSPLFSLSVYLLHHFLLLYLYSGSAFLFLSIILFSLLPPGTLWNLSSYEPLKMVIINHGLQTMTNEVIIPHSGWEHEPNEDSKPRDAEWTTVFKNTSGCLRSLIQPAHVASSDTGFILEQVINISHYKKHQMLKFCS